MFKGLQFGQAWIDIWGQMLGSSSSDTFLRNGVGVKGTVYQEWARRWKSEGRGIDARTFLTSHLAEIRADALGAPGCPECGTQRGLHASYCSRSGSR